MALPGFTKATSNNLPRIDIFMVNDFLKSDDRFNSAEVRGAKARMATRESYGDQSIGYVQVKRDGDLCEVKAKVCPEHRVRSKAYSVTLTIDEGNEKVKNSECHDCAAASGGCKHALALLMWVHRRSESPAPTEVTCYWKKSRLASVGTTLKYIDAKDLCEPKVTASNLPDNTTFLQELMTLAKSKKIDSQISRHHFELQNQKLLSASIHRQILEYSSMSRQSVDSFLLFVENYLSAEICTLVEIATRSQCNEVLWHELRYGRITASKLYEAAHCRTDYGSLVEQVIGVSKVKDTKAMERGRKLEKEVLEEVKKKFNIKLRDAGLYLISTFPVFGASPDAIGDDFIVEVKCPMTAASMTKYIVNDEIAPRYKAQMQLQMMATKKLRGLFCVADPTFEETKQITTKWLDMDLVYTAPLIDKALTFWKKNIFPKIMSSVRNM